MSYNYYNPNANYYTGAGGQYPYQPSYMQPIPYNNVNANVTNALNGKVVDSVDVAKATDVPIGGYGVFPKADLSEIYIKSWNNNGTTSLSTYVRDNAEAGCESPIGLPQVIEKLEDLEKKIDGLTVSSSRTPSTSNKRAEVKVNEY